MRDEETFWSCRAKKGRGEAFLSSPDKKKREPRTNIHRVLLLYYTATTKIKPSLLHSNGK